MDDKPIDHERILKVTKLLKDLDLAEKEIALRILSNIVTVYVEVSANRSIALRQEEDEDQVGFKVSTDGPELQIFVPRRALGPQGDGVHAPADN